jgi:hypothetical protein
MAINDAELTQEMTRVRTSGNEIVIEVAVINRPHPWEPHTSWAVAATLPLCSTPAHIEAVRCKLVTSRKFFALCRECGERNKGHMHSARICMSCAEKNHGVVY